MSYGEIVRIRIHGGGVVERILLAKQGETIIACNPTEFEAAKAERRRPEGIGFPLPTSCQCLRLDYEAARMGEDNKQSGPIKLPLKPQDALRA